MAQAAAYQLGRNLDRPALRPGPIPGPRSVQHAGSSRIIGPIRVSGHHWVFRQASVFGQVSHIRP